MTKTITGTVESWNGHYFCVVCPDAAPHLRTQYLLPSQMNKAQVGDRVTLGYFSSPAYGLWNVVSVDK